MTRGRGGDRVKGGDEQGLGKGGGILTRAGRDLEDFRYCT